MSNEERFNEIEDICTLMQLDNCHIYLQKMPLIENDSDGSLFNDFHSLINLLAMWSTTTGKEKCIVSNLIVQLNKKYQFPILNISGYLNDACSDFNFSEAQR